MQAPRSDGSVRIWDPENGQQLLVLPGEHSFLLESLAFSPDGAALASGGLGEFRIFQGVLPTAEGSLARRKKQEQALPEWQQEEAFTAKARGDWYAALFHLDRLLARAPRNLFFQFHRAEVWAERGEWDKVRSFYEKHVWKSSPDDLRYRYALLCIRAGDRARYRKVCAVVLKQLGWFASVDTVNSAVWVCVVGPGGVDDYGPLVSMARKNLARVDRKRNRREWITCANTLGAALYRAGRVREAA
jgi:hypothetical protein